MRVNLPLYFLQDFLHIQEEIFPIGGKIRRVDGQTVD